MFNTQIFKILIFAPSVFVFNFGVMNFDLKDLIYEIS